MSQQAITYISLISEGLLTAFACAFFYILEHYTPFRKLKWIYRQLIIGVIFGLIAVFGTVFGINTGTAVANVRDAPVIAAGLIFGGPAGVVAAIIGACHRAYIGFVEYTGYYSTYACIISTLIASLYSWALRKWFFEEKTPNFLFGMATAMIMETLHLIILYVTRISAPLEVLDIIKALGLQMIIANGIAVGVSCFTINMLDHGIGFGEGERKAISINSKIQIWLLIVMLSTAITSFSFVYIMQNNYAYETADKTLSSNLDDIYEYIHRYVNGYERADGEHIFGYTDGTAFVIGQEYRKDPQGNDKLAALCNYYHVSEAHIVALEDYEDIKKGDITYSFDPSFIGKSVLEGETTDNQWIFEMMEYGDVSACGTFEQRPYREDALIKYAGANYNLNLPYKAYILAGYTPDDLYYTNFGAMINDFTTNRRVYLTGFTVIFDSHNEIVSNTDRVIDISTINLDINELQNYYRFDRYERVIFEKDSYFMYTYCESYYLVTVIPIKDVTEGRDMMSIVFSFMLALIFAVIFFLLYVMVKNTVIRQIRKVNATLSLIIDGDLEQKVEVTSSSEFIDLSRDINIAVDTLKRYIAEAASRIDQELEFAKRIQTSSLPSAFPAFPTRTDFDVYATMKTAKQVGGDFYDFYFVDGHHIAFLVADVSGKGVPASMFMMESKTMIKNIATNERNVNKILTKVNNMLCENNDANMFVTCWMGIIDLHTGEVKFANAGHNTPLVYQNGKWSYITQKKDLVLGGISNIEYKEQSITLKPGDKMYLYTDGVTEATRNDKELYGEKRLITYLNKHKKNTLKVTLEGVQKDIDEFIGDADQFDDITMLIVEYKG